MVQACAAAIFLASWRPQPLTSSSPLPDQVGGSTLAGVLRNVCARYAVACLNPPSSGPGSSPQRIGWKKEAEIAEAAQAATAVGFEHVALSNHGAYIPSAARHLGAPLMFTTVRHHISRVLSA